MQVIYLGKAEYRLVHQRMKETLADRIAEKCPDTLILCEHPPVYTVGRRRDAVNNLINTANIPIETVERGGDVTFHGPGQLVGYPILRLPKHRKDLHAYLHFLEDYWISLLQKKGLPATTDERNTGVWLTGKKIIAMGISCRRWVTWHGFSCNVDVDLQFFKNINPCGMTSDLVTRLSDHLSPFPSVSSLAKEVAQGFPLAWDHFTATQS